MKEAPISEHNTRKHLKVPNTTAFVFVQTFTWTLIELADDDLLC